VNETATKPDCARDRHLFGPGPKRVLSLDGGGVRGAISVAFLEQIEKVLTENLKKKVRLGDYFDLIGGTSTGAIIAGALALGYSIEDVKKFYFELAPAIFRRPFWRVMGLQAKFDTAALRREIEDVVGDCALGGEELITGLHYLQRMDTGGLDPTTIAHPIGRRFPPIRDQTARPRQRHQLANLVRASTAPFYFDPSGCRSSKASRPGCSSTAA
jgi:predicted acylesterase/phospholipase RssA